MKSMANQKRFQVQDLTLNVKKDINRMVWNEDRYEAFISEICQGREYQKEAIYTALRYILGESYVNLRSLAWENWQENDILHEKYGSWENFERHLQLPNKLSASIDLATGTGKSFVMYGIAVILLAEGLVDRVLVLCPSTTIERELINKFQLLSGDSNLRDLLPDNINFTAPTIINATQTITSGCICVENREAVYEHVSSSIKDSLWGKGSAVAVLNDEAHHIANEPDSKSKKWKEFLENPAYGFHVIVGFSGTCYVGNDYFSDVIYRYSLRSAMEQRFVKTVRYVAEEPITSEENERWQLVYNRHEKLRFNLQKKGILPLTIVVTSSIRKCQEVGEDLQHFLVEQAKITEKEAHSRILVVYNKAPDLPKLKDVNDKENRVEWIVSVSMLNEGWDVQRVFQIVPHEERAFNSKLLIAQVLGRGLRVPERWTGEQPEVTVFNHASWSGSIRHLINEILENERRVWSKVISDSFYHFELHNLNYKMLSRSESKENSDLSNPLEEGIIDLPSEGENIDVSVDFEKALTGNRESWKTTIRRKVYAPEEVASAMFNVLEKWDMETSLLSDVEKHTNYTKKYPYERLLDVVRRSLKGDKVCSEKNKQRLLKALASLRKETKRIIRFDFNPDQLEIVSTRSRPSESVSAVQLHREKVIFITNMTRATLEEEEMTFFDEIQEPNSVYKCFPIWNSYDFKTPLNMVVADAETERFFIRELVSGTNGSWITAWIKSTPTRFYGIDYTWRKGEYPKHGTFNPDFFIKIGNLILVIEVKDQGELSDPSPENVMKNVYAIEHFRKLNIALKQAHIDVYYHFHFIAPSDIPEFFTRLREGTIAEYRSQLDVKLKEVR